MLTRDLFVSSAELPVTVLRKVRSIQYRRTLRDTVTHARAIALTSTVVTVPTTGDIWLTRSRPTGQRGSRGLVYVHGTRAVTRALPGPGDPGAGFRIPCPPQPLRNCRNSRRDLPTREDTNGLDIIDTTSVVYL